MRNVTPVLLLITVFLVGCSSSPEPIRKTAAEIRQYVPQDWSVSTSNNRIRIRSNYEVFLVGRISRPAFYSTKELGERGYGIQTNYEITLTLVPLLSENQYLQLKNRRAPFLDYLEGRREATNEMDGKTEYGNAMRGFTTNLVPTFYTSNYSIFVERPIDRFLETYPSNVFVQAEAILSNFGTLFRKYPE